MIDYPLTFHPILVQKIWGGNKLKEILHKNSDQPNLGESWEIADVEEAISVVKEGSEQGKSLKELLKIYGADLVGSQNFENFPDKFPLLIKFIDAKTDLSIQVHPDDHMAQKRHNSFGKTEMWYIMEADQNANLIVGFEQEVTQQEYLSHLKNNTLESIIHYEPVKEGDSFFINAGKVHAIGGGILLAEIQQTSDITYRIYDWNRTDANGNYRELHTDEALDVIQFTNTYDYKRTYTKKENATSNIAECPYFITNFITINGSLQKDYSALDSFVIFICTQGTVSIKMNTHTQTIKRGETVLLPATAQNIELISKSGELLEVYI